jgi:hypothetical protein
LIEPRFFLNRGFFVFGGTLNIEKTTNVQVMPYQKTTLGLYSQIISIVRKHII